MDGCRGTVEPMQSVFDDIGDLAQRHFQQVAADMADVELRGRVAHVGLAMLDASVWFTGFRNRIEALEFGLSGAVAQPIIDACETMQDRLQNIYASFDSYAGSDAQTLTMLDRCRESARLFFDEVEQLRWAVMNAEVDYELARGGPLPTFTDPDALIAHLRAS